MPFLVGDRVTCNAAKVLGNKHAKQRYGRLFKEKELLGDVERIDGKGRSVKYIVYFDEVATSKAFSARSIRRHSTAAGGNAEASIPTAISISSSSPNPPVEEPHDQESNDVGDGSSLSCHGVQWKVVDGIVEDWRSSPQFGTHILWGNDVEEVHRTPLDYWKLSFPSQMLPDVISWTSDQLPVGCPKATEEEILAVFGVLYSLTRTSEARRDLWSTKDGLFPAPRFGERYGLSRDRFEILLRHLSFCSALEATGDKWAPVRRLVDGFNERRIQKIFPGWQLCVDESVSSWRGKDGDFCSDGMPHVTCIERKPKGVGCELKNCADADAKIILQLEIQEGASIMANKEYVAEYKLAGTAQLLRLTKPWHGSGRAISADPAFASVTTAIACRKNGMHFTGLVKTATRMYPKKYMDEVEFPELGDDVTLVANVEGHNIMAHAWGDKVRKCFISTHSTTLPGKPSNKRRWREMLNEDGDEIGQTEVFNKTLKRRKVVESYFDAASIIDINNHLRQGGLALETAWRTQSWACRVISTVLGMVETDAYLLFKRFHPGSTKMSHSDFTEAVAEALLTSTNKRKRTHATQQQDSHETLPHNIAPLSLHPLYDKNSASWVATYASRACSVCKSPCKNYCTVCSEMANGSIVALCELKSKHGSACIVKHIYNQ